LVISEPPACAELTEKDIQQIRQIIREELETIKIEIAELKITISEINKRMDEKFKAVEDKISLIQWFIGLLVAIVVAAIVVCLVLVNADLSLNSGWTRPTQTTREKTNNAMKRAILYARKSEGGQMRNNTLTS